MHQLKSPPHRLLTVAVITLSTLAIVGSLVLADKYLRLQQLHACLILAQNQTTTTCKGDSGEWRVQEVTINAAVYQECLSKKGL